MAEVITKEFLGVCKYCGQIRTDITEAETQAEADEKASQHCRCPSAMQYKAQMRQKAEAKSNVRELFVEPAECWNSIAEECLIKIMDAVIDEISEYRLKSVTFTIPGIGKATISINGKDEIVVARKTTMSESITASK